MKEFLKYFGIIIISFYLILLVCCLGIGMSTGIIEHHCEFGKSIAARTLPTYFLGCEFTKPRYNLDKKDEN